MAGKAMVFGGPALSLAMNNLTKQALADIVVDRATAELGEGATDSQIAALVQTWADPVLRARGDKPISLADLLNLWLTQAEQQLAGLEDETPYKVRLRAEIQAFRAGK